LQQSHDDRPLIAVVDDEECIRRAMVRLLKSGNFNARAFGSAREFCQSLESLHVDCIVLDLQMPDMTGLDLQSYLRMARPELPIPVIIITAQDEPSLRDRCFATGVDAYLHKPVEGTTLLATVRQLVDSTARARSERSAFSAATSHTAR
jgi:CheY-like chemotaxis protein